MWHPWTCVRLIRGGAVNSVGLTNPGLDWWVHWRAFEALPYDLAMSIRVTSLGDARVFRQEIATLRGRIPFVEVNTSCPNVMAGHGIDPEILRILASSGVPLILKLSRDQVRDDVIEAADPHVAAYHAINTIPWPDLYPTRPSPLARYGLTGGVSGSAIHAEAVASVRKLSYLTRKPIIGGGGIGHLDDVRRFEAAGASAFSIGTCFLRTPWRPNRIVQDYQADKARRRSRTA
jgi:dihydroorotate dehydrogenase (NAD+) catalytic subunit